MINETPIKWNRSEKTISISKGKNLLFSLNKVKNDDFIAHINNVKYFIYNDQERIDIKNEDGTTLISQTFENHNNAGSLTTTINEKQNDVIFWDKSGVLKKIIQGGKEWTYNYSYNGEYLSDSTFYKILKKDSHGNYSEYIVDVMGGIIEEVNFVNKPTKKESRVRKYFEPSTNIPSFQLTKIEKTNYSITGVREKEIFNKDNELVEFIIYTNGNSWRYEFFPDGKVKRKYFGQELMYNREIRDSNVYDTIYMGNGDLVRLTHNNKSENVIVNVFKKGRTHKLIYSKKEISKMFPEINIDQ